MEGLAGLFDWIWSTVSRGKHSRGWLKPYGRTHSRPASSMPRHSMRGSAISIARQNPMACFATPFSREWLLHEHATGTPRRGCAADRGRSAAPHHGDASHGRRHHAGGGGIIGAVLALGVVTGWVHLTAGGIVIVSLLQGIWIILVAAHLLRGGFNGRDV